MSQRRLYSKWRSWDACYEYAGQDVARTRECFVSLVDTARKRKLSFLVISWDMIPHKEIYWRAWCSASGAKEGHQECNGGTSTDGSHHREGQAYCPNKLGEGSCPATLISTWMGKVINVRLMRHWKGHHKNRHMNLKHGPKFYFVFRIKSVLILDFWLVYLKLMIIFERFFVAQMASQREEARSFFICPSLFF